MHLILNLTTKATSLMWPHFLGKWGGLIREGLLYLTFLKILKQSCSSSQQSDNKALRIGLKSQHCRYLAFWMRVSFVSFSITSWAQLSGVGSRSPKCPSLLSFFSNASIGIFLTKAPHTWKRQHKMTLIYTVNGKCNFFFLCFVSNFPHSHHCSILHACMV